MVVLVLITNCPRVTEAKDGSGDRPHGNHADGKDKQSWPTAEARGAFCKPGIPGGVMNAECLAFGN